MKANEKDAAKLLSEPRELCKTCYNWLSQEDVGPNDFPHCGAFGYESHNYLIRLTDTCSEYLDL